MIFIIMYHKSSIKLTGILDESNETLRLRGFLKKSSIQIDLNGNFLNYLDIVLFKFFFQMFLSCLNPKILCLKVDVLLTKKKRIKLQLLSSIS